MVVIARFVDRRRATRMRAWLVRSHIPAYLHEGVDGRQELAVRHHDESRALDLLLTLFRGLDIDHMHPEPGWQRAMQLENLLLGATLGMMALVLALIAWWTIPVLAVVPVSGVLLVALVVFIVVASHPGPGWARQRIPGERLA